MKYSKYFWIQSINLGKVSYLHNIVFAREKPMIKAQTEEFKPNSDKFVCLPKICEAIPRNAKNKIPYILNSFLQAFAVI